MIPTSSPAPAVEYRTTAELEAIADAADVGITRAGDRYYAVVVDRGADVVRVYAAVVPASERTAS